MDRDRVKVIAVQLVVWTVLGFAFGIVCDRMGVSVPVYLCLWLSIVGVYVYFQSKAEEEKQKEVFTEQFNKVWQEAYKAGFEEALKKAS